MKWTNEIPALADLRYGRKRPAGKKGAGLDITAFMFLLDDLAHCRTVYTRLACDDFHSVTVIQARLAHCRIASRLILSHTGRKQALQSEPVRPALSAVDFLECSLGFQRCTASAVSLGFVLKHSLA